MISRKTRRGIVVLLFLTTVSYWAARDKRDESPERVTGIDPKLNYVLRDFELQAYNTNGKTTLNLKAPVLRNNPLLEIGTIENPRLVLHQEDITWNLTADSATITADKEHIELLGKVYIHRQELSTPRHVELITSELNVEVTAQTASTNEPVSFFDGLNTMNAVGMQIDMKHDTFQLKQQVKAVYAVN